MNCTYDTYSQKLTISNPLVSNSTGTLLIFTVDSFFNPYSSKPRSGYFIATLDENGLNSVDSTFNAGILLTEQVTNWAPLINTTISRPENVTTVGEVAIGSISFSLGFPVDMYCRLLIIFPSDMPLTSDFK